MLASSPMDDVLVGNSPRLCASFFPVTGSSCDRSFNFVCQKQVNQGVRMNSMLFNMSRQCLGRLKSLIKDGKYVKNCGCADLCAWTRPCQMLLADALCPARRLPRTNMEQNVMGKLKQGQASQLGSNLLVQGCAA